MTSADGAAALFRAVGLLPDGPAVLGRPVRAPGSGVYVVELPAPLPVAPIELTRVGKWIEHVPGLRLDGEHPTSKALAARIAAFWLPSRSVLYLGSSATSVAARITALERHVLGDPRPHPAAQWLKALRVDGLRVWWAATDAPEEYEDALLDAFAESVPTEERAGLPDSSVVLPFANLRRPTGDRKRHGITGSVIAEETPRPAPPTRIVELPPGDADGASTEAKGTGTVRRAPRMPPVPRATPMATPVKSAAPRRPPPIAARPGAAPVHLTADGLARLQAELDELTRVRRPEVIARIKAAKELGDLRENADYTAAREEQSFLEGRIQAIEAQLRHAVVVDAAADAGRVVFGSRVTVESHGEELTFTIVGPTESDPRAGRISNASPVGRALLGRAVGDEAIVETPGGDVHYRVLAVD